MILNKENICIVIVVLFHLVGLGGFLIPGLSSLFTELVPFHLLLMLTLLVISGYEKSRGIFLFAFLIYGIGFMVEVVGVNTGLVFGSYNYGDTLGVKLFNTPLLIGVNWLILVYCTGVVLHSYQLNKYILCTLGAVILVAIDILIEPVAIKYDYWSWTGGIIPVQNYVGWFIVSFLMFIIFSSIDFKKQNPVAIVLLISQTVFFMILNKWGA